MSVNEYYQKNIGNYTMNATRKKNVLELVPNKAVDILDIGCGQGELAQDLKKAGKQITGVDISTAAIEIAKKNLHEAFCFNIEDEYWPQELLNKKFDCIIASEVIEHLFETDKFIKNVKSILKIEGVLILTTPNFLFWKNRLKMLLGKFAYEESGFYDKGHIHFFTRNSLQTELNKLGFQIDQEHNFYPNLYQRNLNFLGDFFPGFFAYQLIIRAKKYE